VITERERERERGREREIGRGKGRECPQSIVLYFGNDPMHL
jgi:hypothetical protein